MAGSGMRSEWVVELDDGRVLKAMTDLRDTRRWERDKKRGWFDTDRPPVEAMVYRAWSSLLRAGEVSESFAAFDVKVVDIYPHDTEDEDAMPDPTETGPGDE